MSWSLGRGRAWVLCAVLSLVGGTALADDPGRWEPVAPPDLPEDWDWIQFTSGEWLKGKLIAMYDGRLEFDSDQMDLQTFDWDDVYQVRTARVMQVGLLGHGTAIGRLHIVGDTVRVIGEQERQFDRSRLITIAAGAPKEINYWSGRASLGFNTRSGNTDLIEYTLTANIQRRTVRDRVVLDYMGNYTKTEGVEVADNNRASVAWSHYLTDRLFATPVFFEYFADPFQNINHRETIGGGVGYTLMDTKRTTWDLAGGPAYQRTKFSSVEPGTPITENTPALVVGTVIDVELISWIDFGYDYRFQLTNEISGQYNHHMVAGFETELTRWIDFDIKGVWDRIEKPRPNDMGVVPEQDDIRLIVALGLDF